MTHFYVDQSSCLRCGICGTVCPLRIITPDADRLPSVLPEMARRCIACGQCAAFCPSRACAVPGYALADARPLDPSLYPTPEQVEELVFARRTIRNFRPEPVPRELLTRILDAVRWAPTGQNRQNLRWIVLDGREQTVALVELMIQWLEALQDEDPDLAVTIRAAGFVRAWRNGVDIITRGAPQVAILAGPHRELEHFDSAVALTYLEILAQAHGIGCCWGGYLSRAFAHPGATAIREFLDVGDGETVYCGQMLGYPEFTAVSRPPRKPLRVTWK